MNPCVYIPKSPADFIGPAGKLAALLEKKATACRQNNDPAKIIIIGPPGVGKTAVANFFAARLTDTSCQVESVNGQNVTVDLIRRWQESCRYASLFGDYNVKVVNELDKCPAAAQVLLLTYLDEMPAQTAFVGTSNLDLAKMEERFQTRLQQFKLTAPDTSLLTAFLAQWNLPERVRAQIAVGCGGNVRAALLDAQSMLEAA